MHEVYREEYEHNGKIFEIIIFQEEVQYIIKSFHNRLLTGKFTRPVNSIDKSGKVISAGKIDFGQLAHLAKKYIVNRSIG